MSSKIMMIYSLSLLIHLSNTIFYGNFIKNDKMINALSPVRNQNQPRPCGASWAFAIASSMSDQFNARKDNNYPEVVLSPQMLMSCFADSDSKTCDYEEKASNFDMETMLLSLKDSGLSDESCNNWNAATHETCDKQAKCKDCANGENIHHEANCFSRDFHSYRLTSHKKLTSTQTDDSKKNQEISKAMLDALNKSGPTICAMRHSKKIFTTQWSRIDLYTESAEETLDYVSWVSIVGYIETPLNVKNRDKIKHLWVVRPSFGDLVGNLGLIYLDGTQTVNSLNILDNCYSILINKEIQVIPNSDPKNSLLRPILTRTFDITQPRFNFDSPKISLKADDGLNEDDTPLFWGNKDGINYMTWIKNQHIPVYCGSCWAQAATSVINDRLNIKNQKEGIFWPKHVLSVQSLINCRLGGSCFGGDSSLVYEIAKNWKIPTDSCRAYEAKNPDTFSCEGPSRCYNADRDTNWPIEKFNGVTVEAWEMFRGETQIKKALLDGPLACFIEVTDEFEKYTPKQDEKVIFNQKKDFFEVNHVVSIVGWGRDDVGVYWIVRNSWGVEYGYSGMFYIRNGNVLGLESNCMAPTKMTFRAWDQ